MTINAPAAVLLLLYQTVGGGAGRAARPLTGTIQNDVLKEYIARGTYIYPPRPSLRLVADTFAYCRRSCPGGTRSRSPGYHMAEAGATPVQEIAFTLANAREYVRAALAAGLAVDEFAPRLSFFFVARTTLLEEVAKFRAARRMWARIMREEFGAPDPKSQMLRFHTQTAGRAADRPAAGGEPGPGHRAGAGRGARRHPVPAHQLLRRGARAAQPEGGPAGRAHPAGAGQRDRPDRHRRPVRRLVRDRVDDRRHRGGRDGADGPGRGSGRRGRGDRARVPEERDRALGLPGGPADRRGRAGRRRREQVRHRRGGAVPAAARSTRRMEEEQAAPAGPGPRPAGRRTRSLARFPVSSRPRTAPKTCCIRCGKRCAGATLGEVSDALRDVWGFADAD